METAEKIKAEHDALRTLAGALRLKALETSPPPQGGMNELRWSFARALLRHLPNADRLVYARLRKHPDPDVAWAAEEFSAEAHELFEQFQKHSTRWTPDVVDANWESYRRGVLHLTALLDDRMERVEQLLLPHLETAPALPPVRSPEDRNWASEGWRIREMLGIDR